MLSIYFMVTKLYLNPLVWSELAFLLTTLLYFQRSAIHLMWRASSLEKNPDAGKDRRQKEKWAAEDQIITQRRQLNGHESEQTLGESEGQESLACCGPWGHKESDTT